MKKQLNTQAIQDELEQALKRYENPQQVKGYIEGLIDGAKHYKTENSVELERWFALIDDVINQLNN